MNLDQISSVWAAYAEQNNVDLINKQRTINNETQTQFAINYSTPTEFFSWIAFCQQSPERTTGITSVIIEIKNKLNLDDFKFDRETEIRSEFEDLLFENLQPFKGVGISLNNNFIKIDCKHIFNTEEEFTAVKNLLNTLKKI